jgi:hypothetical protein
MASLTWFEISCMAADNFCFYLQNRLIQTSQTGGQWHSDTSPFNIPCSKPVLNSSKSLNSTLSKFRAIGFFNEVGTLEFSSILIYSELQTGLYTQWVWLKAAVN